jgi:proteic killer suppression protein
MVSSSSGDWSKGRGPGQAAGGECSTTVMAAWRKPRCLDAAERLADLRQPTGNHLEALAGHRHGQHSIRVNDQWRLCFVWRNGAAHDVEITDYH